MESNNITAAPQIADVEKIYAIWYRNHVGNRLSFYTFMVTPSVERDMFLADVNTNLIFIGNVLAPTINK